MARIELLEQLLQEGANIDNQVIGMLARAGIGAPGKEGRETRDNVLAALKSIRVGNDRNAPYLYYWDVNPNVKGTGKTILPIVQYMIDAYKAEGDGAQIPAILNRIGDAVRLKHSLKTTASKSWEGLKKNKDTDTLEKLEAWLRNESGRAENKIKVHTSEFDFPELEVYSDENVDCYKADNPEEAIELGDKYTFCISYKGGGNQFYTYRFGTHPSWHAKQKTSCYFCWFKDSEGNKNHADMIVLHVGEDGEYMATESQNGIFPWLSKSELLEKYPVLRPALPYMPYKKPTQKEEIARYFGERVTATYEPIPDDAYRDQAAYNNLYNNLAKYDPEYLDVIVSTGCKLDDKAFEYVFKTVDNSDLVRGNHGDSITKKYIEIGYHSLTPAQVDMLKEAGYEKEVDRAMEVRVRRKLAISDRLDANELEYIIKKSSKEELTDENNAVRKYILKYIKDLERNDLTVGAKEYLLKIGLPELAYAFELGVIGDHSYSRWTDDVFKVALEYVDKGDIKKRGSVIREYLSDMRHDIISDGMRKILADHGYGKEAEKYDTNRVKFYWQAWQSRFSEDVEIEETPKGYILTYKEGYRYSRLEIPRTPKKPIIEIRQRSTWDVDIEFQWSGGKEIPTKKLPIIKNLEGEVLKNYTLDIFYCPSFSEFKVSWDNIRQLNVHFFAEQDNLRGLPKVPKKKVLSVSGSQVMSLEGLEGSDFDLILNGYVKGFKGMPKKLNRLVLRMDKEEFDQLSDKTLPDEVGVFVISEDWRGDIEALPKRMGELKLNNFNDKITAKGVEYLGELPHVKDIPTKNVKWYASHVTEENLKKTSGSDTRYDREYRPVFYGANSAKPISKTMVSDYFYSSCEIWVYPFVSSLKGLICPKATHLDRRGGGWGQPSTVVKKPVEDYILYVYQNVLIKSLEGMPTKNSYTGVYLYNCPALTDISALLKCDRLKKVYISKCNKVSKDDLKKLKDKGVSVYKIDRVYMRNNMPMLSNWSGKYSTMESLIRLQRILNGFGIYG